jgi:hypothetical protein
MLDFGVPFVDEFRKKRNGINAFGVFSVIR